MQRAEASTSSLALILATFSSQTGVPMVVDPAPTAEEEASEFLIVGPAFSLLLSFCSVATFCFLFFLIAFFLTIGFFLLPFVLVAVVLLVVVVVAVAWMLLMKASRGLS